MTKEEAIEVFGFDPTTVGYRHRGWWVVEEVEFEEECGNAQVGDLCVKARDGGSNPIDPNAFRVGNCVGSSTDGFDSTYRYYYYRPLSARSNRGEEDNG